MTNEKDGIDIAVGLIVAIIKVILVFLLAGEVDNNVSEEWDAVIYMAAVLAIL